MKALSNVITAMFTNTCKSICVNVYVLYGYIFILFSFSSVDLVKFLVFLFFCSHVVSLCYRLVK